VVENADGIAQTEADHFKKCPGCAVVRRARCRAEDDLSCKDKDTTPVPELTRIVDIKLNK
jgi:hypothetical protein